MEKFLIKLVGHGRNGEDMYLSEYDFQNGVVRGSTLEVPEFFICGRGNAENLVVQLTRKGYKPTLVPQALTMDQMLLIALESSGCTPEEFGERLEAATGPHFHWDPIERQQWRHSMRVWLRTLPYGQAILDMESGDTQLDPEAKFVLVNMFGTRTEHISLDRVKELIPTSAHLLKAIGELRVGEAVDLVPGGQAIRVK